MSSQTKRIFFGALLVLAGGVFLVQQIFNIPVGTLFIALIFAAGGAVFLYLLINDRQKWWAAIPGFTLLGLGVLIACGDLFPRFSDRFGGSIFLGFIALSFLVVELLNPAQWWPIIPAGVLATVALVAGLRDGGLIASVLFMGIGATFVLINFLPVGREQKWVWIPGGICLGLGVVILVTSGALLNTAAGWFFALLFIAGGAYLVIRSATKKEQ
jgi:hypothetical protein